MFSWEPDIGQGFKSRHFFQKRGKRVLGKEPRSGERVFSVERARAKPEY